MAKNPQTLFYFSKLPFNFNPLHIKHDTFHIEQTHKDTWGLQITWHILFKTSVPHTASISGSVAQRMQADVVSHCFLRSTNTYIHTHPLTQANIHIHALEENIHFLIRA